MLGFVCNVLLTFTLTLHDLLSGDAMKSYMIAFGELAKSKEEIMATKYNGCDSL